MFDHYRPKPDIQCPVCGASGLEWQGKDGPCALYVWEQGRSGPIDQLVPKECKCSPEEQVRLPTRFEIYAVCRCPTFLEAVGLTEDGVWTRTDLLGPGNAIAYPHESEREFRKRRDALTRHPGHKG